MGQEISKYYDPEQVAAAVRDGAHRDWVGGLWEEMGRLQYEFVRQRGLQPRMRFLDIGCGCFRAGVYLIEYLNPGCYYGIDLSQALMDAGYEKELAPRGLTWKLPKANLLCDDGFHVERFGVMFDMALAQSVFTHLPFNHIRLCLTRLAAAMRPGGVFYATAFISDPADWAQEITHPRGGITTHPAADPYHYRVDDFAYCVAGLPWRFEFVGDWGHPRSQAMLMFTRQ